MYLVPILRCDLKGRRWFRQCKLPLWIMGIAFVHWKQSLSKQGRLCMSEPLRPTQTHNARAFRIQSSIYIYIWFELVWAMYWVTEHNLWSFIDLFIIFFNFISWICFCSSILIIAFYCWKLPCWVLFDLTLNRVVIHGS